MTPAIQPPTDLREALEPCPFCTTEFPPVATQDKQDFVVICTGCSALGPTRQNVAEARAAWNTRALASATTTPASALEAATDLRTRLSVMGIDLTDDARTAINQAFLGIPTPASGIPASVGEVDEAGAEIRQLRGALIEMGRMIPGCVLRDEVSTDFLMLLPEEMRVWKAAALSATAPQQGEAEPFGYWVEQKHAEPVLLRKPAYIPEPSDLRTVTPLYRYTLALQPGEAVRLALEDATALDREAEDADQNGWHDWGALMRQSAGRIRTLTAALAQSPAPDATVREKVAAEFAKLFDAARGCEFDLRPADGPIARLTLFVHQHGDAILAALAHPQLIDAGEDGPFVPGPVWFDESDECWTSEVQIVGGHAIVATVHGASEAEASARRDATLRALTSANAGGR